MKQTTSSKVGIVNENSVPVIHIYAFIHVYYVLRNFKNMYFFFYYETLPVR